MAAFLGSEVVLGPFGSLRVGVGIGCFWGLRWCCSIYVYHSCAMQQEHSESIIASAEIESVMYGMIA